MKSIAAFLLGVALLATGMGCTLWQGAEQSKEAVATVSVPSQPRFRATIAPAPAERMTEIVAPRLSGSA